MGYMISATAKDFTIMIRYQQMPEEPTDKEKVKLWKNEDIFEFKGKKYITRIGVIDLEGKLYTKLSTYVKEVEEAYTNFVLYYNQ